ncbi:uncharacterized protein LOC141921577 [Strix aluco]|uniref:uncharacterized protein LOC141921577 n=1 Tax=Strix aluco TaxID=111821 RepID=UPI003DA239D1
MPFSSRCSLPSLVEALTDAEAVLSTDVWLTRGHRRSERRLLLLQEELVIAKLRRGTTLHPQLRLALDQLWVLSSGKEAAGDVKEEEEEEDSDEDRTSIIFIWPSGTCVATFGSRALKQLWLGKLLGTPEGATGARVTDVPSIKLLQKELSRRHAWKTFSARSLERLMEDQAEADPKQGPPTAPSTNGGGLCHSPGEFGNEGQGGPSFLLDRHVCTTEDAVDAALWPEKIGAHHAAAGERQAGSGCSRALFGQPLAALCGEAGTLPRPIQELLDILHQRGPSTEGIFRRSDRGTALQKLKEDLDRGADVDLANQPVILLAALLKDFLRSIPGKLLVVGLYQDWMQAMERPSKEARVEALKVVAEKLPAAHLLLLQRLISLLQNIGHHVPTSRMTSSNLAICLGPNLLGPPDEDLLPLEAMLEVTEKVKLLVEFLIENGSDILGEEMAGQMSPEPMGRSTELPLGREHGPAGEAVAQLQAKAFLDAPASLLSLQRAAGADAVLGAEWAEAPVALSPATPATTVEALGCAEEPKSLSEQRRFAGSRQENASQRKRKREEAWAEETEPHQAKKRREEKMGTARKAGRCKRSGSPRC